LKLKNKLLNFNELTCQEKPKIKNWSIEIKMMNKAVLKSFLRVKTFTIKKIETKSCTKQKSMRTYHTLDEKGDPRKITAIVSYRGWSKKKSIRAIYEREALIVNTFKAMVVGETVTIDFVTDTVRTTVSNNKRHDLYKDAYDEAALLLAVNRFSERLSFYLRLFVIAIIIFLAIYAFIHIGNIIGDF
jgi:hypothetical protein